MTDNSNNQLVVRAKFNFQQTNEDELSFSKGDVIHVTRVEEGGWWEGTLNGRTGWFPSNYVREVKA
nr:Chain A, Rho guanine nucleotide exchange factor 7 [Homo sapiens]